ncbi:MAG TPA: hypothetical protein O0X14_02140 [Methanocorpusculum sp.]|nr:hypothetical protein [Methanocorpusculum sp.]
MKISTNVTDLINLESIDDDKLIAIINGELAYFEEQLVDEITSLEVVDTGNLRDSHKLIEAKKNGDVIKGQVTVNSPYAVYNEYGTGIYTALGDGRKTGWVYPCYIDGKFTFRYTKGMRARPFFRNTIDKNKDKIMDDIQKKVKEVITNG